MKNSKRIQICFMLMFCFFLFQKTNAQINADGNNVTKIKYHKNGKLFRTFQYTNGKTWKSYKPGVKEASATYTENKRDRSSVYMSKGSTNVQFNLDSKKVIVNGQVKGTIPTAISQPERLSKNNSKSAAGASPFKLGKTKLVLADFGTKQGWNSQKNQRLLADVNNDGKVDIVGFGNNGVYVGWGDGKGNFQKGKLAVSDFSSSQGWNSTDNERLLADVNNDGNIDIIGFGNNEVFVGFGDGKGNFQKGKSAVKDFCKAQGWNSRDHKRLVADVDKDGNVDIIGFGNNAVYVGLGKGNGQFVKGFEAVKDFVKNKGGWNSTDHERLLADITGDGRLDIVAFGANNVYFGRGQQLGKFGKGTTAIEGFTKNKGSWNSTTHKRLIGDANNDGKLDIIGFGDEGVIVAKGKDNGTFEKGRYVHYDFGTDQGWRSTQHQRLVADVNNDGRLDVVGFGEKGVFVSLFQESTTPKGKSKFDLAAGHLEDGAVYKITIKDSKKCLDVEASSSNEKVKLVAHTYRAQSNQLFIAHKHPQGFYSFTVLRTGKKIDESSPKRGALIYQYSAHNKDNQKFKLYDNKDGYFVVESKTSIDARKNNVWSIHNNSHLISWTCHDIPGDHQLFKFEKVDDELLKEDGFRVSINGLHCLQSNDGGSGSDEPYIEVHVDGKKHITWGPRPMNESDRAWFEMFTDELESWARTAQQEFWLFPGSVYAKDSVVVKLYEADNGQDDDHFGENFLNNDDFIGELKITKSDYDSKFIEKTFGLDDNGKWSLVCTKKKGRTYDTKLYGKSENVNVRVPVLDQGNESACVAFSVVGALTTKYLNDTKPGNSKEELFDPLALYERRQFKSAGWEIDRCLNVILKEGIPFKNSTKTLRLKSYYIYHNSGKVEKMTFENGKYSRTEISPHGGIHGHDKMRAVIQSGEPLITDYRVYHDYSAYAGVQGVYGGNITTSYRPSGHVVIVIGYDNPLFESDKFPTWTFQNSLNTSWGDKGLGKFIEGASDFDDIMYRIGEYEIEE